MSIAPVIDIFTGKHIRPAKHEPENPYEPILNRYGNNVPDLLNKLNKGLIRSSEPYIGGSTCNVAWRAIKTHHGTWNRPFPWPNFYKKRNPVLGASVSKGGPDPFAWLDNKYKVSYNALMKERIHTIHTRSDLIAKNNYLQLLKRQYLDLTVYIYYITTDDKLNKLIEPGAPSFKRRLEALRKLRDHNIDAYLVRINFSNVKHNFNISDHFNIPKKYHKTHNIKLPEFAIKKLERSIGQKLTKVG